MLPGARKKALMLAIEEWFPLLTVGGTFTTLGLLKVYGLRHGIVGGGKKPLKMRVLGSCPTWSRHLNIFTIVLFLLLGFSFLGRLAWELANQR